MDCHIVTQLWKLQTFELGVAHSRRERTIDLGSKDKLVEAALKSITGLMRPQTAKI